MTTTDTLIDRIKTHRVFDHPLYEHWAATPPSAEVSGALFHQVQSFCAATRPGGEFPTALRSLGWNEQALLIEEIVDSESGHGPELATMAGHIVNRTGSPVFDDVYDTTRVEAWLKSSSDRLLAGLPGYDRETGLTPQAAAAIEVFRRRFSSEAETTVRNLGTALALEIISNQSLIPGEKRALIDSGHYKADLDEPEMHYMAEHWGEDGAEQQHEANVIKAVSSVMDASNSEQIEQGVEDFLSSLCALWDVLDAALLASGLQPAE
ncbi:hypothetical protein YWIDRAFT_07639 [Streptomyces sp. SceaMP-e96]|uniref:hypothetical protein n=1 Tax=unclassified Streptomyces TaxID=2593676 RepID=UPI0008239A65|nr:MULTISPECIES: hypothetical protein [unclassified Streptomyces]MYT17988.1 hypothetical protein [Streptomyces sp. SID4951]SCK50089.1 hypothetical protein YWIDRAFT_07639 [Streptomyces sp. SceaMP-e96]